MCWHDWIIKKTAPSRVSWHLDDPEGRTVDADNRVLIPFILLQLAVPGFAAYWGLASLGTTYAFNMPWPLLILLVAFAALIGGALLLIGTTTMLSKLKFYDKVCLKCHKVKFDATQITEQRKRIVAASRTQREENGKKEAEERKQYHIRLNAACAVFDKEYKNSVKEQQEQD